MGNVEEQIGENVIIDAALLPRIERFYIGMARQLSRWVIGKEVEEREITCETRVRDNSLHLYINVPRRVRGRLIGREGNMCRYIMRVVSAAGKTNDGISVAFHVCDESGSIPDSDY